ncbi:MAG: HD domain-containing protein [Trebonia sp.]
MLRELRAPAELIAHVGRLVRSTAGHRIAPEDHDGAVLCDADLAVLGSLPDAYRRYAAQVRGEYHEIRDAPFRAGRAAILRDLLDRPAIYRTERAREMFEAPARRNLLAEIERLTA